MAWGDSAGRPMTPEEIDGAVKEGIEATMDTVLSKKAAREKRLAAPKEDIERQFADRGLTHGDILTVYLPPVPRDSAMNLVDMISAMDDWMDSIGLKVERHRAVLEVAADLKPVKGKNWPKLFPVKRDDKGTPTLAIDRERALEEESWISASQISTPSSETPSQDTNWDYWLDSQLSP